MENIIKHRIVMVGLGTVGRGIIEILLNKREYLKKQYDFIFDIVGISTRSCGTVYNAEGFDHTDLTEMLELGRSKRNFSRFVKEWDTLTLIKESNATVVCELTGTDLQTAEPALSYCKAALESGKHVITCNKGPAALAYHELKRIADEHGVKFLIEGTVMAGTPVLNLASGPLSGCEITSARGILNGTTNFILSQMEDGMSYEEALKKAQDLGYAEADPSGDVEGYDARAKVAILANVVMNTPLTLEEISCTGITKLKTSDIEHAMRKNCRWKLIGSITRENGVVKASVSPEMLPLSHPLAGVMGAGNALTFTTDLLSEVSIVGLGAGGPQTGFAILSDLLALPRTLCRSSK